MAILIQTRPVLAAEDLVGQIRRFGFDGPVYEVIGIAGVDESGRSQVRIRVLPSGDELDYSVEDVCADPGE